MAYSATSDVLTQRIPGASSRLRDGLLVLSGAVVTAIGAQASIPWQPVPFSLQTLAVCLCGLLLGSRLGAYSQIAYILAGAAGAPIFAGHSFGPGVLIGPTGGYLVGFVVAAYLLGRLAERGWDRKPFSSFAAMTLAQLLILSIGTVWLSRFLGFQKAFTLGAMPFFIPELMKSAFVMITVPLTWKALK